MDKVKLYGWQSWGKGLFVGLLAGGLIGAYLEAVMVYSLMK